MYKNILNSEDTENENNKSEVKDKIENIKELGNTALTNPNRKNSSFIYNRSNRRTFSSSTTNKSYKI